MGALIGAELAGHHHHRHHNNVVVVEKGTLLFYMIQAVMAIMDTIITIID
jgi:2-keto-3-deoxy-galactonokinase